jgi:AraC-like DNA-binding protein
MGLGGAHPRKAPCPELVGVRYGRERYRRHAAIERHRHDFGYVAIVLEGGYVEAGDRGRRRVAAGDLLVHEPFETHRNLMEGKGAEVLNLPLPDGIVLPASARASDPDLLARLCERSPIEAAEALAGALSEGPEAMDDWPDLLAAACREGKPFRLGDWALRHGLAAATVSRGFARVYGVSPARYRLEARSRRAWHEIIGGAEPLATVALASGFADQAHMTRSVASVTGDPPGRWRKQGQKGSRPAS